jgi:hypothetical protein
MPTKDRPILMAMKRRPQRTALQTALLSLLGSLIGCSAFLLVPEIRVHRSHGLWAPILFCFTLLALGLTLYLKSLSDLKNGIQNQLWPEEQIAWLRARVESPLFTVLSLALCVAFPLLGLIFTRFKAEAWICFLLSQNLMQLQIAVQRPHPIQPTQSWMLGGNFAPIRSDHWGQR